jgi:hypothetical protein
MTSYFEWLIGKTINIIKSNDFKVFIVIGTIFLSGIGFIAGLMILGIDILIGLLLSTTSFFIGTYTWYRVARND